MKRLNALIKENYSKQEKLVTGAYRRLLRYSILAEKILGEFPSLDKTTKIV